MAMRLHKDDVIEVSANTIFNPKDIKIQRYLAADTNQPKLKVVVNDADNAIGYIEEHIVVRYKFKEIWDLFIKFLFRTPKINNIKFRVIRSEIEN